MAATNSEARVGSQVTSGVTRRQSRLYFVDCKGIFTPILRTWVQKSTLPLQNRGHAEVLKKNPFPAKYAPRDPNSVGRALQCRHSIPALNAWHNTRPHTRLPPSFLGMDAIIGPLPQKRNIALIRKLIGSLMCLAPFFDLLCMGVCTARHWQTSGRLVQELNACTVATEVNGCGSLYCYPINA